MNATVTVGEVTAHYKAGVGGIWNTQFCLGASFEASDRKKALLLAIKSKLRNAESPRQPSQED